jgi:hypothetical protein
MLLISSVFVVCYIKYASERYYIRFSRTCTKKVLNPFSVHTRPRVSITIREFRHNMRAGPYPTRFFFIVVRNVLSGHCGRMLAAVPTNPGSASTNQNSLICDIGPQSKRLVVRIRVGGEDQERLSSASVLSQAAGGAPLAPVFAHQ